MVMENRDVLNLMPVEHPDPRVQRIGFDLNDPYVELCWGPVVGPTATLLLRRLPVLWIERVPAVITHGELSRSLGLGASSGKSSRLMHSIDRLVRYRLARWEGDHTLEVYRQAPGLEHRQVARLPDWSVRAHERLLDHHIQAFEGRDATADKVATITARLDRLQRPHTVEPTAPTTPVRSVGR